MIKHEDADLEGHEFAEDAFVITRLTPKEILAIEAGIVKRAAREKEKLKSATNIRGPSQTRDEVPSDQLLT